jgi:hypothetical protein
MIGDHGFDHGRKVGEALGQFLTSVGLQLAVGDVNQAIAFSRDDAPAGCAQPRVEAENYQASFSSSSSGTS